MTENIIKLIQEGMAKKGLNVSKLEQLAGLSQNSARNILTGKTKNPSIKCLTKIMIALDLSPLNLLDMEDTESIDQDSQSTDMPLFVNSVDSLVQVLREFPNLKLSLEVMLSLVADIYNYSHSRTPPEIEPSFIKWLIRKNSDTPSKP